MFVCVFFMFYRQIWGKHSALISWPGKRVAGQVKGTAKVRPYGSWTLLKAHKCVSGQFLLSM